MLPSIAAPFRATTDRIPVSPIRRAGKKKVVDSDGKSWFFQRLLNGWLSRYATKCVAIVELKHGRIFAKTDSFALEEGEARTLALQMRSVSQPQVKLGGVRYRVFHHNPRSRLIGQVSADPYDKIGSRTGFVAFQADRDHGAMVVGTYDDTIPAVDCEKCCKELATFLYDEDLVRSGCDRYSADCTVDCPCLAAPQSSDLSVRSPGPFVSKH